MTTEPRTWVYGDHVPDPGGRDLVGLKANWIVRSIAGRSCCRVLDYGCGEGKHLGLIRQVAPAAARVGVDIRAPHRVVDFEFRQLEPDGSLPFPGGSFDMVISCDVLEHVASIEHSLDEIRRVLAIGGTFVGFVPLEGGVSPYSLLRAFSPNLYRDTKDHVRNLTQREMRRLLSTRFRIVRLEYSYHLFGASMDAAFFASFKLPLIGRQIKEFWRGSENPYYRKSGVRAAPSLLGRLMTVANALAYHESVMLRNVPIGACGLHFHVERTA